MHLLFPYDWFIRYLHLQAAEQVQPTKWPVSVHCSSYCICIYLALQANKALFFPKWNISGNLTSVLLAFCQNITTTTRPYPSVCHRINLQPVCKSFLCEELALSHRDQGKACFRVPLYLNSTHVCVHACVWSLWRSEWHRVETSKHLFHQLERRHTKQAPTHCIRLALTLRSSFVRLLL